MRRLSSRFYTNEIAYIPPQVYVALVDQGTVLGVYSITQLSMQEVPS